MKKRWGILLLAFCLLGLTACAAGKLDTEKIRDIEFTVLSKEEVPEEFMTQIEEEKSGQMKPKLWGQRIPVHSQRIRNQEDHRL